MASAMRKLEFTQYDLIILDLMLPTVEGGSPVDVGGELVPLITRMRRNRFANMVALTAYRELFSRREESFAAAGVFLIHYEEESDSCKPTILSLLRRSAAQSRWEFLIVCALELERVALFDSRAALRENRIENGLDIRELIIGQHKGRIIGLPSRLLKNYSDPADNSLSFQIPFSFVPAILKNKMGTLEFFSSLLERAW